MTDVGHLFRDMRQNDVAGVLNAKNDDEKVIRFVQDLNEKENKKITRARWTTSFFYRMHFL